MTITASELRTIGNERTGRSESQDDIDKFVKSWVNDLTLRGIFFEAEETVTLVTDQVNYVESAFTNSFKNIDVIVSVDSNSKDSLPMTEIPWQRYKERVGQGVDAGKPREFTRYNETVYLWPKPNATDYPSMKISGSTYHDDSTTIAYPNRYRECGIQYVIFKIYEKYGKARTRGKEHFDLYEFEVAKITAEIGEKEPSQNRYNDI